MIKKLFIYALASIFGLYSVIPPLYAADPIDRDSMGNPMRVIEVKPPEAESEAEGFVRKIKEQEQQRTAFMDGPLGPVISYSPIPPVFPNKKPTVDKDPIVKMETDNTEENKVGRFHGLFAANAKDPDGDKLHVGKVTYAGKGKVEQKGDWIHYTPPKGFSGKDKITYTVVDTEGASTEVTLTVEVTHKELKIREPKRISLKLEEDLGSQMDPKAMVFGDNTQGKDLNTRVIVEPKHGALTLQGDLLVYTPNKDYAGSDFFVYQLEDNEGNSIEHAVVDLTIKEQNDAPTLEIHNPMEDHLKISPLINTKKVHYYEAPSDGTFEVHMQIEDIDSNAVEIKIPNDAPVTVEHIEWRNDGSVIYRFKVGKWGPETELFDFEIFATDGEANSQSHTIMVKTLMPKVQILGSSRTSLTNEGAAYNVLHLYDTSNEQNPTSITEAIQQRSEEEIQHATNVVADEDVIIKTGKESTRHVEVLFFYDNEDAKQYYSDSFKSLEDILGYRKQLDKMFPNGNYTFTVINNVKTTEDFKQAIRDAAKRSGGKSDLLILVNAHGLKSGEFFLSGSPESAVSSSDLMGTLNNKDVRVEFQDIAVLLNSCECGTDFCNAATECSESIAPTSDDVEIPLDQKNKTIQIDALANDYAPARSIIEIVGHPKQGSAYVGDDGKIHYTPREELFDSVHKYGDDIQNVLIDVQDGVDTTIPYDYIDYRIILPGNKKTVTARVTIQAVKEEKKSGEYDLYDRKKEKKVFNIYWDRDFNGQDIHVLVLTHADGTTDYIMINRKKNETTLSYNDAFRQGGKIITGPTELKSFEMNATQKVTVTVYPDGKIETFFEDLQDPSQSYTISMNGGADDMNRVAVGP